MVLFLTSPHTPLRAEGSNRRHQRRQGGWGLDGLFLEFADFVDVAVSNLLTGFPFPRCWWVQCHPKYQDGVPGYTFRCRGKALTHTPKLITGETYPLPFQTAANGEASRTPTTPSFVSR